MKVSIHRPGPDRPHSANVLILESENDRDQRVLQRIVDDHDPIGMGRTLEGKIIHVQIRLDEPERGRVMTKPGAIIDACFGSIAAVHE